MAFLYPWGNTQQLNLDWILQKIKELETGGTDAASLQVIANAFLAASYSAGTTYNVNDIVYRNEALYRCNTAIASPGEPWTPSHWDEITIGPVITNLVTAVANMSSDDVFNDSNVTGTHVTEALNQLASDLSDLSTIISGLGSDDIGNDSNVVSGDTVTEAIDDLQSTITTVENKIDNKILYFVNQAVSVATNAEIFRITDSAITSEYVVLECYFVNRSGLDGDVSWASSNGYISFTGTCTTATTANVVIAQRKP